MPYEFVEDMATADIAFRAWGETLEEIFRAASDAVTHVMVEELDTIQCHEVRSLTVQDEALDMLLFNFLQELVYCKDAEQLLLRVGQVTITEHSGQHHLTAIARGERLDPKRHPLRVDVKAVTLHHFSLQQTSRGWEALVILDI